MIIYKHFKLSMGIDIIITSRGGDATNKFSFNVVLLIINSIRLNVCR